MTPEELYSEEELMHFGVGPDDNPPGRGSGRYPKGSGKKPFQHDDFYKGIQELRNQGLSDKEIAEVFNMNTSEFRALNSYASSIHKKEMVARTKELAMMTDDDGEKLYSNVQIGKMLGIPESSVRNYLKDSYSGNSTKMEETMNLLRAQCTDTNYIDVGPGAEFALGCSKEHLKHAVRVLEETENYTVENIYQKQAGTGLTTTIKVLAPPGTDRSDIYDNKDYIKEPSGGVESYPIDSNGGAIKHFVPKYPTSVDSSRVKINYADTGTGKEKDGVIEIRRGLDDLNLGNASYAQVRIMVDGTHYLKGMAIYSDDMPEGTDIIFNTNKNSNVPMKGSKDNSVLKPIKKDPKNPFGATINKQLEYDDGDGKKKLSPINIVNEEGAWGGEDGWSRTIASQMLSKQNAPLIKKQLDLSYAERVSEYDDIMMVTNPVIKKKLLESFADGCDTAAVELKAAPFPRQTWKVILPVPELSPNEIYAPGYEDGENVVLIRYPHGGIFEIPQLTVNNRNKAAKKTLGLAVDAVGINAQTAEKLSGADFDGDTVLVIPANSSNSNVRINTKDALEGLKGFDAKTKYAYDPEQIKFAEENPKAAAKQGIILMTKSGTQREMGIISNLITDMTMKGAPDDDLAAAVRHSMVVIDANKHKLDYTKSYVDNNIEDLKRRYQKKADGSGKGYGGASTLISRAKSEARVPERKEGIYVVNEKTGGLKRQKWNPETGEKQYTETGRTKRELLVDKSKPLKDENGNYILDKKGKKQYEPILDENGNKQYVDTGEKITQVSTQMMEAKDARELLSTGYSQAEMLYANYANRLKGLANEARKAYMTVPNLVYVPEAAQTYKEETTSLKGKVAIAQKNAPKERQAQLLSEKLFNEMKLYNPDMTEEDEKKYKNRALNEARETTGAGKRRFNGKPEKGMVITDDEWKAIQSGAITNTMMTQIVDNSDIEYLKRLAMPQRSSTTLSSAKIAQIRSMENSGFSTKDIADHLGVSVSTVNKYLKGEK